VQKTDKIWFDGRLVPWDEASVHITTHTLHYGVGVFEAYAVTNVTTVGRRSFACLSTMLVFTGPPAFLRSKSDQHGGYEQGLLRDGADQRASFLLHSSHRIHRCRRIGLEGEDESIHVAIHHLAVGGLPR